MPTPKRSAKKPTAARAATRSPSVPKPDPQLELFARAVAAAQQKRWKEAASLLRRLLHDADDDPYLQAVIAKNRGDFAAALAICRRGGRHRRDERMAYLAASILALEGEFVEAAELLALAVGQNARNRVQAFHDSDFAEVLGRAEFAFVLDPS